ncbi:MAG: MotA/TolQ/ExbB proton channel family protein [Bacteroidetes bacterium]|nr:MAG: MotA/TolQ/ExbB proton channel family protein [Bacteroidota bacterium]
MVTLINVLIISLSFAQSDVKENTAANVEQTENPNESPAPFDEAPKIGGLEMFARKIVGSGLVDIFIQGGFVMWPILLLVIWALATIIWKLVSLNYAKINLADFLDKIQPLLEEKRYEEAIEVCENTRGPVASIIHAGLLKTDKGVEAVEKSIESAGVVEMAFLEKGFIPISTTINLAPMFGFFGTVVGMIGAFDAISKAGEVEPTIVASGIKVALITTAAGLAVAIPVQFFNNIFLSMVDGIVIDMQRGSEKVVETLVENK